MPERKQQRAWVLVDATGQPLGRLAVRIATILRGKHKPVFAPHIDVGDFVVVIHADKVALTGAKDEKKLYQRYSGYRGGLRQVPASSVRERHPERLVEHAVHGMMPRNRLSRSMLARLKVYAGGEHPHQAQSPTPIELKRERTRRG